MFLSIVVPVYNGEKYVAECLESLIAQDIPRSEYEIICVNDGSKDGSLEILESYQASYEHIRIIDQKNSGVSAARNAGLDAAEGDYVWFVDCDDFITTNCLAQLRSEVKDVDILNFGSYSFTGQLSDDERALLEKKELQPTSYANHVCVIKSLFRRDFLNSNAIRFDTDISFSEDSLFHCKCLLMNPEMSKLEKTMYIIRYWGGSSTAKTSAQLSEKRIRDWTKVAMRFYEYYLRSAHESYKAKIANLLMSNLWFALLSVSKMPVRQMKASLKQLKAAGLFPFVRPDECTLTKSYLTTRTDMVGRIFEKLYLNMHRPAGFFAMVLWQRLWMLKEKLR